MTGLLPLDSPEGRVRWAQLSDTQRPAPTSDAVHADGRLFAVADGLDHSPGSGQAVLGHVLRLMGSPPQPRRIRPALRAANWTVWSSDEDRRQVLATVTLGLWTGFRMVIGHVGDSRAYLVSPSRTVQLTTDGADVVLGESRVPRSIETVSVNLVPEDLVLFVTDGMWHQFSERSLRSLVGATPEEACAQMRSWARNGSEDASAVVVQLLDEGADDEVTDDAASP